MTLSLSREQEDRLEQLLKSGRFDSLEQFISYSLRTLELEDEIIQNTTYSNFLRDLLKESQLAKSEGRVMSIPEGQLAYGRSSRFHQNGHAERHKKCSAYLVSQFVLKNSERSRSISNRPKMLRLRFLRLPYLCSATRVQCFSRSA
jgi:Arc/MetJ-type ribon-helix-helix transcriptional regulator